MSICCMRKKQKKKKKVKVKVGCTSSDDVTAVPRFAGFTAWQRSRAFRVYSHTLVPLISSQISFFKDMKTVFSCSRNVIGYCHVCVMFIKIKLIKKRWSHVIDYRIILNFILVQTDAVWSSTVLNENVSEISVYFANAAFISLQLC